ncbi:hypothetical protein OH492_05055 [Vibrio chagasii]|nr:hypothetical protein [Vibrio chagasii]
MAITAKTIFTSTSTQVFGTNTETVHLVTAFDSRFGVGSDIEIGDAQVFARNTLPVQQELTMKPNKRRLQLSLLAQHLLLPVARQQALAYKPL